MRTQVRSPVIHASVMNDIRRLATSNASTDRVKFPKITIQRMLDQKVLVENVIAILCDNNSFICDALSPSTGGDERFIVQGSFEGTRCLRVSLKYCPPPDFILVVLDVELLVA